MRKMETNTGSSPLHDVSTGFTRGAAALQCQVTLSPYEDVWVDQISDAGYMNTAFFTALVDREPFSLTPPF
jgi:hypothetical protein